MNQAQFARRIGVARETVARYESGLWPVPRIMVTVVRLLARVRAMERRARRRKGTTE